MSLLLEAMTYAYPKEIPVSVGMLPAAWFSYGDELIRFCREYPDFFPNVPASAEEVRRSLGPRYQVGEWTDEWGCVWVNKHEGMDAIALGHPLKSREAVRNLEIPADREGNLPHGFMYLRLLDLRGFEEAMIDFAEEPPELQMLIDKVLAYNLIQAQILLRHDREIYHLGDDLGMQNGLAIGAEKWRKYLLPCFRQIYSVFKNAGRHVYMHTDGCIWEIMPDLHEAGADMINPQYRANGLDNLVAVCRGKIPINLDLDRQMFPFASPSQLDDHVRECVEALYLPQGGLGLSIEFNYDVPLQNMEAVLDAARKYRTYNGRTFA